MDGNAAREATVDCPLSAEPGQSCFCESADKTAVNAMSAVPANDLKSAPETPPASSTGSSAGKRKRADAGALPSALAELNCAICAKLLHEPVTTPCGHTFCRACLARALDFRDACPLCRAVVHMADASSLPVTHVLAAAIRSLFPTEAAARRAEAAGSDADPSGRRLPLFPLNAVVFPGQTFTMNIYEARYRLMLRRIMAGAREFGLIALRPAAGGCAALCEVGSVLRVTRAHRLPDGRSLIETVAQGRFTVSDRAELDGYLVGRAEPFEDSAGLDGGKVRAAEKRARELIASLLAEPEAGQPRLHDALRRTGDVPPEADGPSTLGLWLAGVLVADKRERQRLLEMNDAALRLTEMTALLEHFSEVRVAPEGGADAPGNREQCCLQ